MQIQMRWEWQSASAQEHSDGKYSKRDQIEMTSLIIISKPAISHVDEIRTWSRKYGRTEKGPIIKNGRKYKSGVKQAA